mgnify:CR=1 FL=1
MKNFICFLFSKLGTLFLVLFCSSLYAQDISVKSITVNDNSAICSYDASNFEIVVVFNTDAAFDFSRIKKIIVGGDSFTDKNMPKHALPKPLDFKMWGELIGEKLNCEVINAAISGYGNQAIYHKTLDAIMNNKDADQILVKSFLACKPLVEHLFG